MLIYYFFYWKCRFEIAVMCLIFRKPHKRYQCKSFISQFGIKSCGMAPQTWRIIKLSFLSSGSKAVEWTPLGLEKSLKSFLSSGSKVVEWNPQVWKIFKFISEFRIKSCWMTTLMSHLVEIREILILHVLSNDACKFAIKLFPISWGSFENVNLLFFLLKMQIWNCCNVLDIQETP